MWTQRTLSAKRATLAFTLVALGLAAGCSGGEADSTTPGGGPFGGGGAPASGDFESDSPRPDQQFGSAGNTAAPGAGSAAGGASGAAPGKQDGNNEAAEAILEADVIQVRGSRLYALSRYAGLAVVDISQRDQLKLLGKKRLAGQPFEMYVRDDVAYAMFSSWGTYTYDAAADSYSYAQTSHVEAIDVTDPGALTTIGSFDLPGEISDSRMIGDVLYAVSYENGYCWRCTNGNATTVTSLAVGDPKAVSVIDTLSIANPKNQYGGWGRRSVTVTNDRMYVAGEEYSSTSTTHGSTIQIVDISAGTGKLAKGAAVPVKGMIESRWQMDEHEGVLRVISQPGWWSTTEAPAMQTFAVGSATEITPLASVDLKLPKPNERLRSVRFDQKRGYAITAEQQDPLFTLDFSDPKQPRQVGELEMPGWVYHMEPRGDRIFALGFDNQQQGGSLHVSLFDVADFAKPKLLSRVPFGGKWSQLAEDQDRIHKAFNILPEQGLIMVPYSGYSYDSEGGVSCGRYESGIQLVDFTNDSLTKRGVAPQKGDARRAFLADGRLFAVSDDAVRTFDIDDRDAPKQTAQQLLANRVNRTISAGDKLVRVSMDWYNSSVSLEVVPRAEADTPTPLGTIELSSSKEKAKGCYSSWGWDAQMFAVGDLVHLIAPSRDYQYYEGGSTQGSSVRIVTVSVADPTHPAVVADTELDLGAALNEISWGGYGYGYGYGYYGYGALVDTGSDSVQVGTTVAFARRKGSYTNGQYVPEARALEVFDLSDPKAPRHASTVTLPKADGETGLLTAGDVVLSSHWEKQPSGKVRFYVDRVDLSDPAQPKVLPRWSVPGSLAAFDPTSRQAVTVDYKSEAVPAGQYGCGNVYGGDGPNGPEDINYEPIWWTQAGCVRTHRTFKLVKIDGADHGALTDSMPFPTSGYLDGLRLGDARLFTMLRSQSAGSRVFTLGLGGDRLETSEVLVEEPNKSGGYYYWGNTYITAVADTRALLLKYSGTTPKVFAFDTRVLAAPTLTPLGDLSGYPYETRIEGDTAVCALDVYGVQLLGMSGK
ncbi:MAG: beta-propeller domain-containing protein [Polyangiaceae bacterium]|nr:beta-propeller domain-containing protein [Polyangiaceae bacterium]